MSYEMNYSNKCVQLHAQKQVHMKILHLESIILNPSKVHLHKNHSPGILPIFNQYVIQSYQ
jgi:hypothetical protein